MRQESPAQQVERLRRNKRMLDDVRALQGAMLLQRARAAEPDIWSDPSPLVSVQICTFNRPELLVERAIASVLRQTYPHFEVVVVGDHAGPETEAAMSRVSDPRVRFHNLPARPVYPEFPRARWQVAGSYASHKAAELSRGSWITWLDDDDAYPPDHIEAMLRAARDQRVELVYAKSEYQLADGRWTVVGSPPLRHGQICSGAVLFHRRLGFLRCDAFGWILDAPVDWLHWYEMERIGATIGFLDHMVYYHFMEFGMLAPEDRAEVLKRVATPEEMLADLHRTGGDYLLDLA